MHCGHAADFWNRFEEDIDRAVDLHSTCFRLSIEWSRLEPVHGQIDQHGLQRYHEIFDCIARWGPVHASKPRNGPRECSLQRDRRLMLPEKVSLQSFLSSLFMGRSAQLSLQRFHSLACLAKRTYRCKCGSCPQHAGPLGVPQPAGSPD